MCKGDVFVLSKTIAKEDMKSSDIGRCHQQKKVPTTNRFPLKIGALLWLHPRCQGFDFCMLKQLEIPKVTYFFLSFPSFDSHPSLNR